MIVEATLTSKGQLTIPKAVRNYLRLNAGDKVLFIIRENKVELEAIGGSILDWYGALQADGPQDLDEVRAQVRQAIVSEVIRA